VVTPCNPPCSTLNLLLAVVMRYASSDTLLRAARGKTLPVAQHMAIPPAMRVCMEEQCNGSQVCIHSAALASSSPPGHFNPDGRACMRTDVS
jgi:hypothetical protein